MTSDQRIEPGFRPTVQPGDTGDVPDAKQDVSPDYLAAPKRGKGVRRLNRVPLLVVGGLLLLTTAGISYTFYQRQQAQIAKATAPADHAPLPEAAAPPVKPETDSDFIAGPPQSPPESLVIGGEPSPPALGSQPTVAPMPLEHSDAYKRRLEQIQRVEERRLTQWEAALGSDGPVAAFSAAGGSAGTANQQAGMMLPNMAGGPGATAEQEMQKYLAALGGAGGAGGAMGGPEGGQGGGLDMAAANRQQQKQAFLSGTPDADTYLDAQRKAAVAMSQEVKAGTIIPGVMISGLNSDLPGQIIGQVRENVYDSATGTQLLIPAGSRLVGTYDNGITLGQKRALVAWSRLIYPDSSSISLAGMPGADLSGYAGFKDKVDNHYWKIFGNGLMLSLFSAGIQLSQPESNGSQYDARQVMAAELGREMGQLGMEMTRRNMLIQPTIEIRPGFMFNVMVTKDILLPTWRGHPLAGRR